MSVHPGRGRPHATRAPARPHSDTRSPVPTSAAPEARPGGVQVGCTPPLPYRVDRPDTTARVTTAAALLLVACAAGAQPVAVAPADTVRPSTLDEVVVTATRTPSRISDTVAEVTVVEREDIERATGRTLPELLVRQPGLQMSSNGGLGKASGVYIRGLEARHTLLLVDGVRLGSATVGTPSFDNLPIAAIDRIEIVRGPLSSLYGSEAVGGVIQVFTRRGEPGLHPFAYASLGSRRYGQLGGGLSFGSGPLDGAVQWVGTGTRGFSATNPRAQFGNHNADDDDFRQKAGSARLGWKLNDDWRLDGLVLHSRGTTDYDDGPGVTSRARLTNDVQSLSARGRLASNWQTRLSFGRSTDVYDTLATASAFTPLGATRTEQRQLGWENTFATPLGTLLALAERIEQNVSRPGQPYSVSDRTIDAAGLGLTGEARGHAWQAGLRHDRNSQFGGQTTGSVGYGYALTRAWSVGGSYGTSFVAPSFNQLYFPGFGNPNLLPEEGRHGELGVRWTDGAQMLRVAWVDNRIRGYIPAGPMPVNVPRTRIDGVVMSWEGRWRGLAAGASFEHLDPRNQTEGSANYGRQLVRRAKDALRASADWSRDAFTVGGTLSAFSARYEDAANTLRLGGFTTADLRADWRYDRAWTIGLRLNNLANKAYETAYGFNQPGREAYLTVRWEPR
jgi:vitamin B12 transporter